MEFLPIAYFEIEDSTEILKVEIEGLHLVDIRNYLEDHGATQKVIRQECIPNGLNLVGMSIQDIAKHFYAMDTIPKLFLKCEESDEGIWVTLDTEAGNDFEDIERIANTWLSSITGEEDECALWKVNQIVDFPIKIQQVNRYSLEELCQIYHLTQDFTCGAVECFMRACDEWCCGSHTCDFEEAYIGTYSSKTDFANALNEESGFNKILRYHGKTPAHMDLEYEVEILEQTHLFVKEKVNCWHVFKV